MPISRSSVTKMEQAPGPVLGWRQARKNANPHPAGEEKKGPLTNAAYGRICCPLTGPTGLRCQFRRWIGTGGPTCRRLVISRAGRKAESARLAVGLRLALLRVSWRVGLMILRRRPVYLVMVIR